MTFLAGYLLGTATTLLACGFAIHIYLRAFPSNLEIQSTYEGPGGTFHLVKEG